MKKSILLLLMVSMVNLVQAQITINSADVTHSGDIYTVSTGIAFTGMDATTTGPNYTWDYSLLTASSTTTDTIFDESATGSLLSFYYIDNAFNSNRSNQAKHGNSFTLGTVSVDAVWDFYYNTAASFNEPGFGAIVNGAPLPIPYSSRDIIYSFPLTFNSTNSSNFGYALDLTTTLGLYYRVQKSRTNLVDGWGSVTTPYGTFNCLRLKSTIIEVDSIYIDSLGFGFSTPPITTNEYKWLANGKGIPILQINTTVGGAVSQINYRDSLTATVISFPSAPIADGVIFPNPTSNEAYLNLSSAVTGNFKFEIFGLKGNLISSEIIQLSPDRRISPLNLERRNLGTGDYMLRVSGPNNFELSKRFSVCKK